MPPSITLSPRKFLTRSDVLAIGLVVLFGVVPFPDEQFRVRGPLIALALLPVLLMPFRRGWPLIALGGSVLCHVCIAQAAVISPSTLLAVAITAFSVTDRTRRSLGIAAVATTAILVFSVNAVALGGDLFDSRSMQFVMFIVVAGAMGDAARSRREYITAVTERAERAEQSRDEEARRRVAEERVRIARDLHDLVAHQISVISLNAGVASSSLESRPERAKEALSTIRSASRTVLTDIGGLLALLRAENADERRDLHPQAGLEGVNDLIDRFAAAGLPVQLHREPRVAVLSPAGGHVAYLALQEGLTNAHKHGTGERTRVDIRTSNGMVLLTVTNPLREEVASMFAGGNGLRGLHERVTAVRGRVQVLRADGEFRLIVEVPASLGVRP